MIKIREVQIEVRKILFGFAKLKFGSPTKIGFTKTKFTKTKFVKLFAKSPWPNVDGNIGKQS